MVFFFKPPPWFWMIELGHHLSSLTYHASHNYKHCEFMELLLHHFLTVWLMIFSCYTNWIAFAILIIFMHNLSDAIQTVGKAIRDLNVKYKNSILTVMILNLIVQWYYGRIFVPIFCYFKVLYKSMVVVPEWWPLNYSGVIREEVLAVRSGSFILISMSLTLLGQNIWWIYHIQNIVIRKFTSNDNKFENKIEGYLNTKSTKSAANRIYSSRK